MSLHPAEAPAIPEATARVARAASPKGCLAMRIRDELDVAPAENVIRPAQGLVVVTAR